MRRERDSAQVSGRAARSRPALLLALLAAPMLCAAAQHSHHHDGQAAPQSEAAGHCPGMTMDQAIENAERRSKARVVKASVDNSGDRCVYVLRLLSEDGRVWTVRVESRSGGG